MTPPTPWWLAEPTRPWFWWEMPHAGVDLETTGVTHTDRLVTANVTLFEPKDGRWEVTPIDWLANPGIPIHPKATETHGYTDQYVKEHGIPFDDAVRQVLETLRDLNRNNWPIVGMNLAFDFTMLHRNALQAGIDPLDEIGPLYDVSIIDRRLQTYRRGKRKLENLCQHYRVTHPGAHDAAGDVLASARVAQRQVHQTEWLGRTDIDELHKLQIAWRREQSQSLQDHFRKTNPKAYVDPCWPVCREPSHWQKGT
jgi:DNA polymerase-3 subunit epsilon